MSAPPVVAPLLWLLFFLFVVALIYAGLHWLEVTIHPKIERLMIGVVVLIVVVVLVFWLFGLIGYPLHKSF